MRSLLLPILGGLFAWLFFEQSIGLNLVVFETVLITLALALNPINWKNQAFILVFLGTLASMALVIVHHSTLAILINLLSFGLFQGFVIYPEVKTLSTALGLAIENGIMAQFVGWKSMLPSPLNNATFFRLRLVRVFVMPLVIFAVFFSIYAFAVPGFQEYVEAGGSWLGNAWNAFFERVNIAWFLFFGCGIGIGITVLFKRHSAHFIDQEKGYRAVLSRLTVRHARAKKQSFNTLGLRHEFKAAIALLASLNLLILLVNILDINSVWLNFEWEGNYLKQFVHSGTYMLILSILISIGVTVWVFRGNLNFLSSSKPLRWLAYLWLFQNAVMVISVMIRNVHYINYFALAYKRIAVFFFLGLTLYGLWTVLQKIKDKKTVAYLFRTNLLAAYAMLVVACTINWDVVIAQYNLTHYDSAFVELEFLASLDDKALPILQPDQYFMRNFEDMRNEQFHFERSYLCASEYADQIKARKATFLNRWETTDWQSWNLADHQAAKLLEAPGS